MEVNGPLPENRGFLDQGRFSPGVVDRWRSIESRGWTVIEGPSRVWTALAPGSGFRGADPREGVGCDRRHADPGRLAEERAHRPRLPGADQGRGDQGLSRHGRGRRGWAGPKRDDEPQSTHDPHQPLVPHSDRQPHQARGPRPGRLHDPRTGQGEDVLRARPSVERISLI